MPRVLTKEEQQALKRKREASFERQIDGFRRLLTDLVAGDDPGRFAECARISIVAHQLIVARATRIDQAAGRVPGMLQYDAYGIDQALAAVPMYPLNANFPVRNPMNPMPVVMGGGDNQAQRDAASASTIRTMTEADTLRATVAFSEAQEMMTLGRVVMALARQRATIRELNDEARTAPIIAKIDRQCRAVEARIEQLTTRMEGRANAHADAPADAADVVPADDPGRHPTGEDPARGRRLPAHQADGQGAVAHRAAGG